MTLVCGREENICMEWTCLLVDLDQNADLQTGWQDSIKDFTFNMATKFTSSLEESISILEKNNVATMIVFATTSSTQLLSLLKNYQTYIGSIPEFQAVVCEDPSADFMAAVFEFGIEQFFSRVTWQENAACISRAAALVLGDNNSVQYKAVMLARSIQKADKATILNVEKSLAEHAEYDFTAAFARGKAKEASGDYQAAAKAFESARTLNKMFRPSSQSLGETMLVMGKVDDAIEIFRQLEKTNANDVDRKANLAAAYIEKGDINKAKEYLDAASKLDPNNSRVAETKAQVMLNTGKIQDAFELMDKMSNVGPLFAAKLNEMGIKLAKEGQGKKALILYQRAHKIVKPELKYKISLNAALACRRLQEKDLALKYLERCEKEYGGNFAKLDRIKQAILQDVPVAGGAEDDGEPAAAKVISAATVANATETDQDNLQSKMKG